MSLPRPHRSPRGNAARLGLSGRALFLAADWAAPLTGNFDLILSNPPYIETATIPRSWPRSRATSPPPPWTGGPDGLAAYAAIVPALPGLLAPGGLACLELGAGQAPQVAALARQNGFTRIATMADLAGLTARFC